MTYRSLSCTCADSALKSRKFPESGLSRLLEASKTPLSPATDSSLTAAETERVLVPEEEPGIREETSS